MKIPRATAYISPTGKYRWWLRRRVIGGNGKTATFIMLNPSTADAVKDDPTIRRCVGFTKFWGYSYLYVLNLFSYRATNPLELIGAKDPVGGWTNMYLGELKFMKGIIVCAWGNKTLFDRDKEVKKLLKEVPLYCLELTKLGNPKHPLYVKADTQPIPFNRRAILLSKVVYDGS